MILLPGLLEYILPGGAVVKNPPLNAGDTDSIPGQEARSHTHAATKSLHATTKEHTCRN